MTDDEDDRVYRLIRDAIGEVATSSGNGHAAVDLDAAHLIDWEEFWTTDHSAEEWLAWPLIPLGRQVAVFAKAKAGKSLLVLDIVAALASGRPILGKEAGRPRHVLYLDYEMTEADLRERLEDLDYGPDVDLSHLHYASLPSLPKLDTKEGAYAIEQLALAVEAELVVVDTLGRAAAGEENSNDTVRAFYEHTGATLKRRGITLVRLDHEGKSAEQGQRGGSAKNDDVDVVWWVRRMDEGLKIQATHSRITWVPQHVAVTIGHDPHLRHVVAAERDVWPAGTAELVKILDGLDVPLDDSTRAIQAALKEAGEGRRRSLVVAARRFRVIRDGGNHLLECMVPGNVGTASGQTHAEQAGNRVGNQREPNPEVMGSGVPPLGGTTPPAPDGLEMGVVEKPQTVVRNDTIF